MNERSNGSEPMSIEEIVAGLKYRRSALMREVETIDKMLDASDLRRKQEVAKPKPKPKRRKPVEERPASEETVTKVASYIRMNADPVSAAQVAAGTGLSRATATKSIAWLAKQGQIRPAGRLPSPGRGLGAPIYSAWPLGSVAEDTHQAAASAATGVGNVQA